MLIWYSINMVQEEGDSNSKLQELLPNDNGGSVAPYAEQRAL